MLAQVTARNVGDPFLSHDVEMMRKRPGCIPRLSKWYLRIAVWICKYAM